LVLTRLKTVEFVKKSVKKRTRKVRYKRNNRSSKKFVIKEPPLIANNRKSLQDNKNCEKIGNKSTSLICATTEPGDKKSVPIDLYLRLRQCTPGQKRAGMEIDGFEIDSFPQVVGKMV